MTITSNGSMDKTNSLLRKFIELQIKLYKLSYPTEEFIIPEIIISHDFHNDAINIYKEFNYPDEYIKQLEDRANWDSTVALTIFNFNMRGSPKIVVNSISLRDDTILHEFTHISDYCGYCKRHDYTDLTYLEFIELNDFLCIYLLSEFRAFYRGALHSDEDLGKRWEYETTTFQKNQENAINKQNLEAYYYHSIKYVGVSCAFFEKCLSEDKVKNFLNQPDRHFIDALIKFLFPLRDKSFCELESYFDQFQVLLDQMIE